jgi:hypothetical protein
MEVIRIDRPEGSVEEIGIHSFISVGALAWVGVVAEADDAMLHRIKVVPAHSMFLGTCEVSTPFMLCAALDDLSNLD